MAHKAPKRKLEAIRPEQVCAPPEFEYDNGNDDVVDFTKLREDYKRNRERFVREYIKDFNGTAAMFRFGCKGSRQTAQVRSSQWLDEPYTQWLLSKIIKDTDVEAVITQTEILYGLKREAFAPNSVFANSASRVAALRALAKVRGMEVTKVEAEVTTNGGIMLVPFADAKSWEAHAKTTQRNLKTEVRK